jgi:hypothetical protein
MGWSILHQLEVRSEVDRAFGDARADLAAYRPNAAFQIPDARLARVFPDVFAGLRR